MTSRAGVDNIELSTPARRPPSPPAPARGTLPAMTMSTDMTETVVTPRRGYPWLMSEDSAGLFPMRTGVAATEAQAWTEAMHAGAAALLTGTIRHLAIAVDDEIPTFGYSPGRDQHGHLDPLHVSRDLTELLADAIRDLTASPAAVTEAARPDRRHPGGPATRVSGSAPGSTCSPDSGCLMRQR